MAPKARNAQPGRNTGFDAGRKVKRRTRHLVVDALGLLLAVMITAASVTDRDISVEIVRHPGNRSTGTWRDAQQPVCPEVVPRGFVVQAMRWVVERNHAWNERARRLIAHHNRSHGAPVAWVGLA